MLNSRRLFGRLKPELDPRLAAMDNSPVPPMTIAPDTQMPTPNVADWRGTGAGIGLAQAYEAAAAAPAGTAFEPTVAPDALAAQSVFAPESLANAANGINTVPATNNGWARLDKAKLFGASRGSAEMLAEIDRIKDAPASDYREHSFGKRLASGLWKAFQSWGAGGGQGGLAGLVGALATGGGISAFSPKYHSEMKKQQDIDRRQNEFGQQAKIEEIQGARQLREAQTGEILRKPEKEAADRQTKFNLEAQKQLNRIRSKAEDRRLKGQSTKSGTAKDGSGRLVWIDGNGNEEFQTNPDGSFEYNLLEKPEAQQIEDGVNVDGTKKYRTVYAKGSQILTNDSTTKYRDAMLSLSKDRLDYQKDNDAANRKQRDEQFKANFGLAQKRIEQARDIYNLAVEKFNKEKAGGGNSDASKLAADRAKIALVNARAAIQKDVIMTKEEKDELYGLLPDLDD